MALLSYTFPVAAERSYLPVLVMLAFMLLGFWLLSPARDAKWRLGGLRLFLAGVMVAILSAWSFVYTSTGRRFHAVEASAQQVRLFFSGSDQTMVLLRTDIASVSFDVISYVRSTEVRCNLQLITTSGTKFVSQYRMDRECKRYRQEMAQLLGL